MPHAQLLAKIVEAPNLITPRLHYADWCRVQKAASLKDASIFIQISILISFTLAKTISRTQGESNLVAMPGYQNLVTAQRELVQQWEDSWVGALASLAESWRFFLGFIHAIQVSQDNFLHHAHVLFEEHPIQHLKLKAAPLADEFLGNQHLEKLLTLDLGGCELTDADILRIVASTRFLRLRRLDLTGNHLTAKGLQTLAASNLFQQLRSVSLEGNPGLGDSSANLLAVLHEKSRPISSSKLSFKRFYARNPNSEIEEDLIFKNVIDHFRQRAPTKAKDVREIYFRWQSLTSNCVSG